MGDISIEECMRCEKCLPRTFIEALKEFRYEPQPNIYYLSDIVSCLRQVFYQRTLGLKEEYKPLNVLWMMKRGKYLEGILKKTDINEVTGILEVEAESQTIQVRGKLDGFDQFSMELIEVKSTKLGHNFVPREQDMLQLQCYVSLYKDIFKEIRGLRLVYLDMNDFKTYDIDMIDRTDYLTNRTRDLHYSIIAGILPEKELSYRCRHCIFKDECEGEYSPPIMLEIKVASE